MRLTNYQKAISGGRARVSFDAIWEDCDRPSKNIFIETEEHFAADLDCNPNSFLLAAVMAAIANREKRILVEGTICPEVRDGLHRVMKLFISWYGDVYPEIEIEATGGFIPVIAEPKIRAASFQSGGVDALATLVANHNTFSPEHPRRIRDGIFVHGLDIGCYTDEDKNVANSKNAISTLTALESECDVSLIPVETNIRHLDDSDRYFLDIAYASVIAGIGHAFHNRFDRVSIASSVEIADRRPIGSHPLIEPNYSSCDFTVRSDGDGWNRFEKIQIIASSPSALSVLRSCFNAFRPAHLLNCGECEKCLRTMTGLLLVDKLKGCPTYSHNDITVDMLEHLVVAPPPPESSDRKAALHLAYRTLSETNLPYWQEMLPALLEKERYDIAGKIHKWVEDLEKSKAG